MLPQHKQVIKTVTHKRAFEQRYPLRDQLDEPMKHILAIKAALWTNGNENDLVVKALRVYHEESNRLPDTAVCQGCSRTIPVVPTEFRVPVRNVTFTDVPLAYCEPCEMQTGSLFLMAALEDLAEQVEPGTTMTIAQALQYNG